MIKYLSILHMAKNILRKQFGNMYGKNKPYELQDTPKQTLPPVESPTFTMTGIILFTLLVFLFMLLYLNRERIYTFLQKIYTDFKPSDNVDKLEEKYNELTQNSKALGDILNMEKTIMERLAQTEKLNKETLDAIEKNKSESIDPSKINDIKNRLDSMDKATLPTIEQKEADNIETEKQDKQGAVKQLEERIRSYRKDQIANYNGFCYIGYDNNKRVCTNVYEGDICMSGQVFPTMNVCINPNLLP